MPEIIVPCPSCQASLLVDEQNAGEEVLCPGCDARLVLPRDLSGRSMPELKPAPLASPPPAAPEEPVRRNLPLQRTGHLGSLPEDPAAAFVARNRPSAHLPERRGISAEEEMRRLATLTADPVSFDLHNVDTKGRSAFPCPGCHRPVWISRSDWGRVVVCEGCSREVIAPDPSKGVQPRLAHEEESAAPRQRTVLPDRRQVENLPTGENAAAGRPRREGGHLPPARTQGASGAAPAGSAMEPIPARGDVDMTAEIRKGPPVARRSAQEQTTAATAFGDSHPAPGTPIPDETDKPLQRMNPGRAPQFKPKHETDKSAETAGNWGGEGPAENTTSFRRTLTLALLILGLGAIAVGVFTYRSYFFGPATVVEEESGEVNPVLNVKEAQEVLSRFFKAETVEAMAAFVRHPEVTLPRMKEYYRRSGMPRQIYAVTDDWGMESNWQKAGVDFLFTSILADKTTRMAAALEVPKDGSPPRLDWESFVSWSEVPWSDFLKTTSEQPGDYRVTITPTDYYNGPFQDRSRYYAFVVKDPANFGTCYAYCEVDSPRALKLMECIRQARLKGYVTTPAPGEMEQGIAKVILRLHFPPDGKQFNQAAIDGFIWNDWVVP